MSGETPAGCSPSVGLSEYVLIRRCDLIQLKQLVVICHDMQEAKETLPILGRIDNALAAPAPLPSGGDVDEIRKRLAIFNAMSLKDQLADPFAGSFLTIESLLRTLTAREGEIAAMKAAISHAIDHKQDWTRDTIVQQLRAALEGKP